MKAVWDFISLTGRFLYELSECESVLDHHPQTCNCCGEKLSGEDTNPYRHQIVEIPPISPIIVEHRLHQLMCGECGTLTRATLPVDVYPSGYGVRVVALVTVLSGLYRHSQRMVQSAMLDIFGISMSLGTVNNLRLEASGKHDDTVLSLSFALSVAEKADKGWDLSAIPKAKHE